MFFDGLELLLARTGITLPATWTASRRRLVLGLSTAAALLLFSGYVSTYLAIIGGIALVVVARRTARKSPGATTVPPTPSAPPATPGLRHRAAPSLVVGFDTYMRPVNDLLDGIARPERAAALVALLDTLELLSTGRSQILTIGTPEVTRLATSGELPRMTAGAAGLFFDHPTVVIERRVEGPDGLHLQARLLRTGKSNVSLTWTVQVVGSACTYRLDAAAFARA